jgi:hypothetical protein
MSRRLKLGAKSEIENICVAFWCVTSCTPIPNELPPCCDHFPIDTVLNLKLNLAEQLPKHSFRDVDWDELHKELKGNLEPLPSREQITDKAEFEKWRVELTDTIYCTIETKVPKTKPSPYMK